MFLKHKFKGSNWKESNLIRKKDREREREGERGDCYKIPFPLSLGPVGYYNPVVCQSVFL